MPAWSTRRSPDARRSARTDRPRVDAVAKALQRLHLNTAGSHLYYYLR